MNVTFNDASPQRQPQEPLQFWPSAMEEFRTASDDTIKWSWTSDKFDLARAAQSGVQFALPVGMVTDANKELGFQFGERIGREYVEASLPEGWSIQSGRGIFSVIRDQDGHSRFEISSGMVSERNASSITLPRFDFSLSTNNALNSSFCSELRQGGQPNHVNFKLSLIEDGNTAFTISPIALPATKEGLAFVQDEVNQRASGDNLLYYAVDRGLHTSFLEDAKSILEEYFPQYNGDQKNDIWADKDERAIHRAWAVQNGREKLEHASADIVKRFQARLKL